MRKLFFTLTGIILTTLILAQAPNAIKYQAVARDNAGNIMMNQSINLTISILQDGVNGVTVFTETHDSITNAYGLITLNIGSVNPIDFATIDWSNGPYFVKVELDGNLIGISQLLSVPYAKYAEKSDTANHLSLTSSGGAKYDIVIGEGGNVVTKLRQCPDSLIDYDGNVYNVFKIGEQCWISENFRATHYANGMPIPHITGNSNWDTLGYSEKAYCYYDDDSVTNADTYGLLYTWSAAMNGAPCSDNNPSGVQGVCPEGWHLPSDDEWEELAEYISSDNGGYSKSGFAWNNVGEHLKASSGWDSGGNGSDDYGFAGLPGGQRSSIGTFGFIGEYGRFWSSSENSSSFARTQMLRFDADVLLKEMNVPKSLGISVRCLLD